MAQELPYAWNFTSQTITPDVNSTYNVTGSTIDNSGDLYIVGFFTGTLDFDPTAGTSNLTSSGGSQDIFFAKYNPQGQLVGTPKRLGTAGAETSGNIFFDNVTSSIYLTGSFTGTADFNPSGTVNNLVSAGGTDAFIARYDADGNFLGASAIGGTLADAGGSVRVYGGDVYITGTYNGTVDFDPTAGVTNLISAGSADVFFARYTGAGTLVWAKSIGGLGFENFGALRIANNAIYLSVPVSGFTVDFDPGPGVSNLTGFNGTSDFTFASYDLNGNLNWARKIGGAGFESGTLHIIDGSDLYVAGGFEQTVDLDPGAGVTSVTSSSGQDAFLCRINASGDLVWSKTWSAPGNTTASIQQVLPNNTLLLTGTFEGTMDLDPNSGVFNQTSNGLSDGYFLRMTTAGNLIDGFSMGSTAADPAPGAISNVALTNFYMAAFYTTPVDLDPTTDVNGVSILNGGSGLSQYFATSYSLLSTVPTAQPTGLTFNTPTADSFNFLFTAAAGSPDGYLVVRRAASSPTGVPKDGKEYFPGDHLGDGVVVQSSVLTNGTSTLMAANTTYHLDVFAFNGAGNSTNYFTIAPLEGSFTTSSIGNDRVSDSLALRSIYTALGGPGWLNNSNWLVGSIDTWFGVTVTANRVTSIQLSANSMFGQLPSTLNNLTNLQTLNLSNNFISGGIPSEVGNLPNLATLNLYNNRLTGSIPPTLGNLSNLTFLSLGVNKLSGSIPISLGNLALLQMLHLDDNILSGSIPIELGNLSNLLQLRLSNNDLSGSIPLELAGLTSLTNFELDRNLLTGSIPNELGNLTAATIFYLYSNKLSGSIPTQLGNLASVQQLILHTNDFTGSIPTELGNLTNLTDLRISATKVSGAIPSSLGNLTNLQILYLGLNKDLTGAVPASFTNLTNLVQLDVQDNKLDSLPNLSGLVNLTTLVVRNNRFTFEDLEPNISKLGAVTNYSPQATFGTLQSIDVVAGQALNLTASVGGVNNIYQWKKVSTNVGTNSITFTIPTTVLTDAATYTLTVTNSIVPSLTLTSANFNVKIKAESFFEWISNAGDLTTEGLAPPVNQVTDQNYSGSWGDFNNDGLEDLYVMGFATQERGFIYKNNGDGTFSKLPNSSYFFASGRSATWADYNNDGFLDCFAPGGNTTATDSISFASVYKNNGNETFTRIPLPTTASAGTWSDTDNDGDVDLITNGGGAFPTLFRNEGNDSFMALPVFSTNASAQWNIITVDVNNDNIADVYIPDDTQRNFYVGNGDNTFTLNATTPLVTDVLAGARGISWADIDNDGDFDAYIMGNSVGNRFYINDGAGNFTFQPTTTILGETIIGSRGSAFADYDNDGYVDLLSIQSQAPAGWYLFKNNGNGTFTKQLTQSFKGGGGLVGASFGDYDNDGFLDIVSASFGLDFNGLYKNKGNSNNWLQVKLTGTMSNRSAIGAKVSVKAGGFWRHAQVLTANGFANQNSLIQQFGLGASTTADSVVIKWPSGAIQTELNIAANQRINITEENADLEALVALYDSTGGATWTNKTNWLTGHVTTWYGVRVANGRVTDVRLPNNNLTGSIPPAIGNLNALDSLELGGNQLTNGIPDVFSTFSKLKYINFGSNQLTGGIPSTLLQLDSLRTLGMARNNLSNTIPAAIGNLTSLRKLWLDENQFSGPLPNELGNLTSLTDLYVQKNQLTGAVPASFANLTNLVGCGLDDNSFTSLPILTALSNLTYFNITGNQFTFESLEPNVGVPGIFYTPQDSLGLADTVLIPTNQPYTLSYTVGGSANTYEWKKNNTTINGITGNGLTIGTPVFADEGTYRLEVQSPLVPGLTLFTRPVLVKVSSLKRDSIALAKLYAATNGNNWTTKTNWNTTPISTGNWFGVTITANRVTQVNLPSNKLQGPVPSEFADLEGVTTINLSNNSITSLPNFTTYPNITSLNVSGNNLDFASLEGNRNLTGINFSGQKNPVLGPDTILVESGKDFVLPTDIGGSANRYQWKRAGVAVSGAIADSLVIQDIGRANMGIYVVEVSNNLVPSLTLVSKPVSILATANLSGKLLVAEGPAKGGIARLLRVTSSNGYDTIDNQKINTTGDYAFNQVVLDDYQIVGFADTLVAGQERALPTYYESTIYWEEADTLFVQNSLIGLNITSLLKPGAPLTGKGSIAGVVVEDDGAGARTAKTKRVGGAGVSARRVQGTGRGLVLGPLVAYVFTNDEGEFNLADLPVGTYRINIQYPGYPMDPNSFVDIPIGSSALNENVNVEALVAEGKVTVRQLIITSIETGSYAADVYPNPSTGNVVIIFEESSSQRSLNLFDMQGIEILTKLAGEKTVSLDLNSLQAGLYLLKIKIDGLTAKSVRISIQR